jgi:hypothetical protein
MDDLFPPSPFTLGAGQSYFERSGGDWYARLDLPGMEPTTFTAVDEASLRRHVVAALRVWVASAGADQIGVFMDSVGAPRGPRILLSRRTAAEAAIDRVASGLWKE